MSQISISQDQHKTKRIGFTLIELSIVLVIVGLVIGGVMFGKDLIQTAKVRSQASQFTRLDQSLYAFKLKYNTIPGDVSGRFGIPGKNGDGAAYYNNGVLNDTGGNSPAQSLHVEMGTYYDDLRYTSLLNEKMQSPATSWRNFVETKLGAANIGIIAYQTSEGGINYFVGMNSSGSCCPSFSFMNDTAAGRYSTTPQESFQLDSKIDDGLPLSGKVQSGSISSSPQSFVQDSTANLCITTVAANIYNTTNANTVCRLIVQSD